MNVVMISRSTLFSNPGGDTVQIVNTMESLKKLGVMTELTLCDEEINYGQYDLLHFFNIIRPADMLVHIARAGKPYVVSTIFADYSEYESKARAGWKGFILRSLSAGMREYLKVVARWIKNGEKVRSPSYLLIGHTNAVRYVLKQAAMLLPNSESEYRRLVAACQVEKEYRVIPNAIDEKIFARTEVKKDEKLVLCVSRIEGIKNQLNLIRALNGTEFKLHIIGSCSTNHKDYFEQCKKEALPNVSFFERMDQHRLAALYAEAKVHILPSWFETTGLSSLEAAAMGCNIVITDRGDTCEYFGNSAFYCEPDDTASIRDAVVRAASAPASESFSRKIFTDYTWGKAAEKTLGAYKAVLNKQQAG